MSGVSPEDAALIETAALLHDMGKIGILAVLLKEHRLNKEEIEIVRQHVLIEENPPPHGFHEGRGALGAPC